jgi:ribosomal protein S18 acetylase RimI-like enzyme
MLERIQHAIRTDALRGREAERIGPFLATFTPASDNPFLNYAIPEAGAEPTSHELTRLAAAFESRGLRPRLEYLPPLAPALERTLLDAGYTIELRTPLMTLTGGGSGRVPDGIELVEATGAEEIRAAVTAMHEAYDEDEPPSPARLAGVAASIESGALLVLARAVGTHEPAGAGLCTRPVDGATELTSIGVRTSFRRRGIAQALAAQLARTISSRGADLVFLMAHGEPEAAIYERAGFTRIGEVLHISRQAG